MARQSANRDAGEPRREPAGAGLARNVVFLDFDGVMQPDYERSHQVPPDEFAALREWTAKAYDDERFMRVGNDDIAAVLHDWTDEAVESVRRIVEECNARIVISSSWRYYDDDPRLECLLKLRGLDAYFDGAISRDLSVEREDAIRAYVREHSRSIRGYVALDDFELHGLDGYFVHVRGGSLTVADADEAIRLLKISEDNDEAGLS